VKEESRREDYDFDAPLAVREARQLNHWLRGETVHLCIPELCCPDYSCCQPELLAPLEERELYVEAHNRRDMATITRMDAMFLGRLLVLQEIL
jgi:hypothetical protein